MPKYPEQAVAGVACLVISILMILLGRLLLKKSSPEEYSMECMYRNFRELFTLKGLFYVLGGILSYFGVISSIVSSLILVMAFF